MEPQNDPGCDGVRGGAPPSAPRQVAAPTAQAAPAPAAFDPPAWLVAVGLAVGLTLIVLVAYSIGHRSGEESERESARSRPAVVAVHKGPVGTAAAVKHVGGTRYRIVITDALKQKRFEDVEVEFDLALPPYEKSQPIKLEP